MPNIGQVSLDICVKFVRIQHFSPQPSISYILSYAAQLCTTFQRWHDVGQFGVGCINLHTLTDPVDIAKATYVNASIENAALLKLFKEEEHKSLANLQAWENHLQVS